MTPDPVLLLVEDDESDVLFLKRAFQKAGATFRLQVAQTGRDAIAYLAGEGAYADRSAFPAPTHVLLDLNLPEKPGLEVLEWIRSVPALSGIHVSILTSSRESRDLRRGRELGAECYLVKPMSFAVLLDLARSLNEWIRTGQRS